VGAGFEFLEVDPTDIVQANRALINELTTYGPYRADVGAAARLKDADSSVITEKSKLPEGFFVHDLAVRSLLTPGDWKEVNGDYFGPDRFYVELDKSGPHWSWDSTTFARADNMLALAPSGRSTSYVAGARTRYQTDFVWRRGSFEGGAFNIRGRVYERRTRSPLETGDSSLRWVEGSWRTVEHGWGLRGAVSAGAYSATQGGLDDTVLAGRLAANHWLTPSLGVFANAQMSTTDVVGESTDVIKSSMGGALLWDITDGVTFSGTARSYSGGGQIAANSHLEGYDDLGARLELHPSTAVDVSASYRRRNASAERLRLEDDAFNAFLFADPPATRDDLAALRTPTSAESDRYDVRAAFHLGDDVILTASRYVEDFSELPVVGNLTADQPVDPYFPDLRQQDDLRLAWNMGALGSLTLQSSEYARRNRARESEYRMARRGASFSGPLTDRLSWRAGATKSERDADLLGSAEDWQGDSWSYDLGLYGRSALGLYRLNWSRVAPEGGSDSGSTTLGLELRLRRAPVYVSGWWRQWDGGLGVSGSTSEAGVGVGWHFSMR
jgi:hypothetical protein